MVKIRLVIAVVAVAFGLALLRISPGEINLAQAFVTYLVIVLGTMLIADALLSNR